jgi:hypothetical protein
MIEDVLEEFTDAELVKLVQSSEILRRKRRTKMVNQIKSVIEKDLGVKQEFEKFLEEKQVVLKKEALIQKQCENEKRKVQNWIDNSFVRDEVVIEATGFVRTASWEPSNHIVKLKGIITLIEQSQITVSITNFNSFNGWTKETDIPHYYFEDDGKLKQLQIGNEFCFGIVSTNTKNDIKANLVCDCGNLTLKITA